MKLVRALIYGLILAAYIHYMALPFWPVLGALVLSDVLSALLYVAFPKKPVAKPEKKP